MTSLPPTRLVKSFPARGRVGANLLIPILLLTALNLVALAAIFVIQSLSLREASNEALREETERIVSDLDNFLGQSDRAIALVTEALASNWTTLKASPAAIDPLLLRLMEDSPAIVQAALLDANGNELAVRNRAGSASLLGVEAGQLWRESLRKGLPYLGEVAYPPKALPFILIARPVLGTGNQVLGGLVLQVDLATTWMSIHDVQAKASGYAYLVDQAGKILACNQSPVGGACPADWVGKAAISAALSADPTSYRGLDGNLMVGMSTPLEHHPWRVVVEIPQREIYQPAFISLAVIGGTLLASAIIVGLAIWLISRSVINRVSELHEGVTAISQGQFDVRLAVSGDDELNALARAFEDMAARLSATLGELRTLYAEQKAVAERLKELDRLKSGFIAGMSHELRTPLNAILGFTRLILSPAASGFYGPLPEVVLKDLRRVERNGLHLLALINDLLDMAKIEAGQLRLDLTIFDLREVVADVVDILEPLAREKGLTLQVEMEDESDLTLEADSTRLRQVLFNLAGNAIKFTEHGSVRLRVERRNGSVRVEVKDTGPGIRPEDAEPIFEPFRQLNQDQAGKVDGTGLGLPISRRLVALHGGRLWVESQGIPGEGTTFIFELPELKN